MKIDIPNTLHERIEQLRAMGGNRIPYREFVTALLNQAVEGYELMSEELSYEHFKIVPDPTMPDGQVHIISNDNVMHVINLTETEDSEDIQAESADETIKFRMRWDARSGGYVVLPESG